MNSVYIVAKYTFIELFKSKITYASLILGIFVVLISYIASEFTYGSAEIVALDVGLGVLSIFSLLIAFFIGTSLISSEIENRTIYMVLSRPISREKYFLGKSLGLLTILLLNVSIIFIFSIIIYLFIGGSLTGLVFHSFIFILVEAAVMLLLIIAFSLMANKTITIIMAITMYASAHTIPELLQARFILENKKLVTLLEVIKSFLPSLDMFNIKNYVLYEQALSSSYLLKAYAHGVVWIGMLLFLNFLLIRKVEFK